jgi:antitoxin ParD1/3/4
MISLTSAKTGGNSRTSADWHFLPICDTISEIAGNSMPTRNVVLTDRQESLIEALVQSGRYQNASEVLREGLRLVESREVDQAAKLDALRAAIDLGVAAIDRGDAKEFPNASALVEYLKTVGAKARTSAADRS